MTCQDGGGAGNATALIIDVPFISQMAGVPSLFCHRMSPLPSPLKFPDPTICQDDGGPESVAMLVTFVPFISQIWGVPLMFWNIRSDLPSSLKSLRGGVRGACPPKPRAAISSTSTDVRL